MLNSFQHFQPYYNQYSTFHNSRNNSGFKNNKHSDVTSFETVPDDKKQFENALELFPKKSKREFANKLQRLPQNKVTR